jgi:hypothetical protein
MFNTGFVLGFMAAIALGVAVAGLLGSARLSRFFGLLAGSRTTSRRRPAADRTTDPTPLQSDVIAALVALKVSRSDAWGATLAASARVSTPEFEPLFRAALATLPTRKAVA